MFIRIVIAGILVYNKHKANLVILWEKDLFIIPFGIRAEDTPHEL